jgi:mono/diheme cytochrome c family protein
MATVMQAFLSLKAVISCVAFGLLLGPVRPTSGQEFETGRVLYHKACANCHGEMGNGVPERYDSPLLGDLSVVELAKVIQETMPEESPGSLSMDEAKAVAIFVHHEFYSPMAQLRNAPPRAELSHLTVDQFRRSILDLMIPFTHRPAPWTDQRGLSRSIHQGDWGKDRKEVEKKVDAQLVFDWGDGKPVPEIDHEKWQVRWSGSFFAPTTGTYEFSLDATIRANLFINNHWTPLIDASVVSFEKSLNTATIFLIGGQSYHITLDASHSKEPMSRVALEWRPPNGIREPIPARLLSPTWSPVQLVCSTPFPPDDSSIGYERGRNVSREWYEANIAAAIEIGNRLTSDLKRWMPEGANDPQQPDQVKAWCHRWVAIALRRPLTDDDKRDFVDSLFAGESSIERAVKKVCVRTLTSPEFQYPGLAESPDARNIALLPLYLWDSVPEEWMIQMASRGEAHDDAALRGLADRMMQDVRFQQKMRSFLHEYLGTRGLRELAKDAARYPEFNERIAADLRTSLELFLDEFATQSNSDLRTLLTADYLYLNGRLAKLYGIDLPEDAPFQKVTVPREQWSGIASHPYLMSGLAYHDASSPIHRGVFLAKRVLGRNLRPPVDAIIPISEAAAPGMTTRERVALQTSGAMCQSCHRVINPLGFTLEHYDALGRFRNEELGKAVDASGSYITTEGDEVAFRGVREMADFLAVSSEVQQAMLRQMFQHLVKQPLAAYGLERVQPIVETWKNDGYSPQSLARSLAILGTLRTESLPTPGTEQASISNPAASKP